MRWKARLPNSTIEKVQACSGLLLNLHVGVLFAIGGIPNPYAITIQMHLKHQIDWQSLYDLVEVSIGVCLYFDGVRSISSSQMKFGIP